MLHSKNVYGIQWYSQRRQRHCCISIEKSIPKVYHQVDLMKQLITSPGGIEKLDWSIHTLPSCGFSKTIMEPNAKHLRVIRAEGIAWSDWGNQSRVTSDLSKMAMDYNDPEEL